MKSIEIKTNISLHYIEDSKFKTTTMGIYIHRPLCKDEASKNALIPMVLKRGSEKYPTFSDIEKKLGDLCGAKLNSYVIKRGEDQIMCLDISTISDKYNIGDENILVSCADLLLDMLLHPKCDGQAFDEEYTKSEKVNLCDMIDALVNDKQSYAQWRLYELMCSGEGYGVNEYGSKEDAEKTTAKSLYDHYKNVLSNSRIDIFVCGEADTEELCEKIRESFDEIQTYACEYPASKKIYTVDEVKSFTDEFDTNQAKLSLGFRVCKDVDYASMLVANSIWGSGPHSKLFNNVREKLSLAYYAFSRYERYKNTIMCAMGIETKNYQLAYDETLLQLENVKNGEYSENEIISAKAFLINQLQSQKDSQYAMIDFYMGSLIRGQRASIDEMCKKIEAVTDKEVVCAANAIVLDTVYFLKGRS